MAVYTIGHSTRSANELLALLQQEDVRHLVDVRRYPASRRHPHFTRDALAATLKSAGIGYTHEPDLGGRRSPRADSPNTAWRSAGFRGYADHMDSDLFRAALERVIRRAEQERLAILCAEAVPWRCHRQLIADALVARAVPVVHILGPGHTQPHSLHAQARPTLDGRLIYPAPPGEQTELLP
ncbi:MAG: DUF488 domain-containing protein [Gemmatimonadetes bacterium]|nr:DUF488 domain-containing protein [Gemmatimonadota bacterium]